jgi:hypothetical protein
MLSQNRPLAPEIESILNSGQVGRCPCCQQTVLKSQRKIYKKLWKVLQILDKGGPIDGYTLWTKYYCQDVWLFRHFELAEKLENGSWTITPKGRAFVKGEITIPKYLYIYNDEIIGESAQQVKAGDVLGDFDLAEVMNSATTGRIDAEAGKAYSSGTVH